MSRSRTCDGGFTLIELLVAVGLMGLLMAGVMTMYTGISNAYRRGMETRALYLTGLTLTDSIDRDLRSAWQLDKDRTLFDGKGGASPSGYHLSLALKLSPQQIPGTTPARYRLRRLTYANSSTGFTRTLETYESTDPDGAFVVDPGNPGYRKYYWVLSKQISNFQLERSESLALNPRLIRYVLYLHQDGTEAWKAMPGYQYMIKSQVWLRRDSANGVNPATLAW